jgi:uncharacterized protein YbjQ (UPF0145 family)
MTEVQCPACGRISMQANLSATEWSCLCGRSWVLRRCSACEMVSHVDAVARSGESWSCVWCHAPNEGYSIARDPATAILADLAAGISARGQGSGEVGPPVRALIVTSDEIPGYRVTAVHGDVFGLVVRAADFIANMSAQFRTTFGGEVAGYTRLLVDSRNQARERMWREAQARGANAVVAMRFDCNSLGGSMSEIAAYGTAVSVEPVEVEPPRSPGPVGSSQPGGTPG